MFSTCLMAVMLLLEMQFSPCYGLKGTAPKDLNVLFLQTMINDSGANGSISADQLANLFKLHAQPRDIYETNVTLATRSYRGHTRNASCLALTKNTSTDAIRDCISQQCLVVEDVFELYNIQATSAVNASTLQKIAPVLLYLLTQNCSTDVDHKDLLGDQEADLPPSQAQIWGYGFLFVTLINLFSLIGVIVLPFMKMAAYKQILIFMVALAVGALAGSGLLFLIPEAFGLKHGGDLTCVFRASTIVAGIYLFYLTERIMRMMTAWKERRAQKKKEILRGSSDPHGLMDIICSVKKTTPVNPDQIFKDPASLPSKISQQQLLGQSSEESTSCPDCNNVDRDVSLEEYENNSSGQLETKVVRPQTIKPLAWMIIFGDGLHNFIDGLSIGTAFTQSTLTGMSVSLAVMCEELPHELGDFAILLNCGMTVKKALMYNFLSACMCYLGLIIGTLLGENTTSHDWVFAIAGGMFLYISLADMMPEMNSASDAEDGNKYSTKYIFLLQNLGMITGFGVMLVLAIFGDRITLE